MKHIQITVDTEGKVQVEGVGFTGTSCDAKMKAFEDGLGSVKKRVNKPEYLQSATATVKQKAGA